MKTLKNIIITVCFFLETIFFAQMSLAATFYVPDDYGTIQSAINAAFSGDTIMVRPGTYYEHLLINDKALILMSTDGPEATVLDGENSGRVVTYLGEGADGKLEGFTITKGMASSGGGIYVYRGDPEIRNSIITNNSATYAGGGIYLTYGACYVYIYDSVISNNKAGFYGGGIYSVVACARPINTTISGNTAGHSGGGIAAIGFCSTAFASDTIISSNIANINGGGLFVAGSSRCSASIGGVNNLVVRNSAQNGGGIFAGSRGVARLYNNTLADNNADKGAGFYSVDNSSYQIVNNIIYQNSALPVFSEKCLSSTCVVTGSDVEGGQATGYKDGGFNIDADPLFADSLNFDYSLSAGSPCIDSGVSHYRNTGHDLAGEERDDNAVDMGAYEYVASAIDADVELNPSTLNFCSKGQWITAYISLPEEINPAEVMTQSIFIDNSIPAIRSEIQDNLLMVKFDRDSLIEYLEDREGEVELTLSGMSPTFSFSGKTFIRVKSKCRQK